MDAQELRNLQEAYMEVCDEAYKKFPYKKVEDKIHKKEADNPTGRGTPQSVKMDTVFRHFKGEVRRTERRENSPKISKAKEAENRERETQKEQVDLYDIILSHLLDEGYAETPEQAEVIMVNMSEDWRESICEAILEYQPFKDKRKRVKSKVKKLESQKSEDPKDLGFRNARLQKRIDSMKTVLGKKNKEITSASQQKSYDSMAKGGFKHHDDPQSKYYIK